uniref:Uncharacterized protein n=1 Tax=Meloidogyne javanica TaxID=6303 RepID=A0A915LLZ5_MELJA
MSRQQSHSNFENRQPGGSSEQSGQLSYAVVAGRGGGRSGGQPAGRGGGRSSSPVPLRTRHLIVNGKDCTVFCDDNQYQMFCETFNNLIA